MFLSQDIYVEDEEGWWWWCGVSKDRYLIVKRKQVSGPDKAAAACSGSKDRW